MAVITRIDLLVNRRTKIVATLGPATSSRESIGRLIESGVNMFRLNMSHGDHDTHRSVFQNIKAMSASSGPVAVMADLCGPKIRTGRFVDGGIDLINGQNVRISMEDKPGHAGLITSQYTALAGDVNPGDRILLADGIFELKVQAIDDDEVICEVIQGGRLTNNKGINLPGVEVSAPSMTEKDFADAAFALELGVDYLALSFVRKAEDILSLRKFIGDDLMSPRIVSKIEKPEALLNAEAILEATDAIMIARGDLGVELPPEEVPVAQTELIEMAKRYGKPVIVATQMLESMITNSRPTRAEVTDVSHAVNEGADAVMLSGETAMGAFPFEAVATMDRIARQTEAHMWQLGAMGSVDPDLKPPLPIRNVIANATSLMSKDLQAHGIMVISTSGVSASAVSSARPAAPIVAMASDHRVLRRMALFWGVIPIFADEAGRTNPNELARTIAKSAKLAEKGGYVLLVRGFNPDPNLSSPSVTIISI